MLILRQVFKCLFYVPLVVQWYFYIFYFRASAQSALMQIIMVCILGTVILLYLSNYFLNASFTKNDSKEKDKARYMQLHESRKDFSDVVVSLHKDSSGTETLERKFHIESESETKPNDYKEVIKYIRDNDINILNEAHFKWLELYTY